MSEHEPKGLNPKQAYELLEQDSRGVLVDIRSSMEFLFVGHPKGAVHVPWIDEPDWDINPDFVKDIRKLVLGGAVCTKDDGCVPIVLICRSGKRSLEAGKALLDAGMKNIFHVDEGFEGDLNDNHQRSTLGGWRFHQLPWEQC